MTHDHHYDAPMAPVITEKEADWLALVLIIYTAGVFFLLPIIRFIGVPGFCHKQVPADMRRA